MKSFLARMNAKGLVTSLVLSLAMTACSSKQGVETGASDSDASEVQAEEDMMLGDEGGMAATNDEALGDGEDLGTPTAEIVSSGSPSLPQQGSWKGSLKSSYTPGMSQWTVSRGESLSLIAAAVYGSANDYKKLQALNPEITDANNISVGQKLRLPSGEGVAAQNEQTEQLEEPATNAPVAEAPKENSAAGAAAGTTEAMPTVSNTDPTAASPTDPAAAPAAPTDAAAAAAPGAMGTVETAAPAPESDSMGGLVKRVDISGKQLKLRNILLGVAAFFLLISGVIFVLSRKKAKA